MVIYLLLDSNDIRRHLSSSEILLFGKGWPYTSTVPKDKMHLSIKIKARRLMLWQPILYFCANFLLSIVSKFFLSGN